MRKSLPPVRFSAELLLAVAHDGTVLGVPPELPDRHRPQPAR